MEDVAHFTSFSDSGTSQIPHGAVTHTPSALLEGAALDLPLEGRGLQDPAQGGGVSAPPQNRGRAPHGGWKPESDLLLPIKTR